MNRRQFVESLGATCRNWQWSWSFVNHEKRWVIFGAWDEYEEERGQVILQESWERRGGGRRKPGYSESIEHTKLVESGYALLTFPMVRGLADLNSGSDTSKIEGLLPEVRHRIMFVEANTWYALDIDQTNDPSEFLPSEAMLVQEGAKTQTLTNRYERSKAARGMCLAVHGFDCSVCKKFMSETYGPIGNNFIQVHHLVPISGIGEGYLIDPIEDLRPVCPNCHAMLHRRNPPYSIEELVKIVHRSDEKSA